MKDKRLLVSACVMFVVGLFGLASISTGVISFGANAESSSQRGAWIFNTGTDSNGQLIPYSDGMMMRAACANCHGADGHGLRTTMFSSPDITYHNLTNAEGMIEPDGEHGMMYTDELIRRAVTRGLDAEGKELDPLMPRWQLTEANWSDLLSYMKKLP